MASAPSKKRNLTVRQRLKIVQQLEEGATIKQVANEYGVSERTIQRCRKNAPSIQQQSDHPDMKRKRNLRYDSLDSRLYKWFVEKRALGDILTDNLLLEKAKALHEEFGGPGNFRASRGWLWRFKLRHGIRNVGIHGEKSEADLDGANKFVGELSQFLLEEDIEIEDVYNMDETGLMWKALPQRTLIHRKEQRVEGKKVKKDRVTVAFCANASGTHKLPPLFIIKFTKPRTPKHCLTNLSVIYRSQRNAWMDEKLFNDRFMNHFKPSAQKQHLNEGRVGKVLLLVVSCRRNTLCIETWKDPGFKVMFLRQIRHP